MTLIAWPITSVPQTQVREDHLDHRLLQDDGDDLQLAATVRAVLQRQHSSRIHRKTPVQAAPNLPLVNAGRWPAARVLRFAPYLTFAARPAELKVSSLGVPRKRGPGHERVLVPGRFGACRLMGADSISGAISIDREHYPNCGGEFKMTAAILEV